MLLISPVQDDRQREQAQGLVREYLQWINEGAQREYGLTFDIEGMVAADFAEPGKYSPPFGRFYLVQDDEQLAGIGCLKRLGDKEGEIQRMYVRPAFRGKGIGRLLVDRLIKDARLIGYEKLRLESLKFLTAAHGLYHSVGFRDIDPYAGNSMRAYQADEIQEAYNASAVFMEMEL